MQLACRSVSLDARTTSHFTTQPLRWHTAPTATTHTSACSTLPNWHAQPHNSSVRISAHKDSHSPTTQQLPPPCHKQQSPRCLQICAHLCPQRWPQPRGVPHQAHAARVCHALQRRRLLRLLGQRRHECPHLEGDRCVTSFKDEQSAWTPERLVTLLVGTPFRFRVCPWVGHAPLGRTRGSTWWWCVVTTQCCL